jgi:two-component system sensor histidine kinase UhpB
LLTVVAEQTSRLSIRVLIVEDDVVDRMACRRTLSESTEFDIQFFEAETGNEGIRMAQDLEPDCILLDYDLPDLNGLEFLAELRKDPAANSAPVLMLTGADSVAIAVEAMRRGAQDFLGKDVNGQYHALMLPAILRILRERQLAKAKRQAEAKYRTLVEQLPAITYLTSADGAAATSYVSPQIQMLGFTPEEWQADPNLHWRQIHPEDRHAAIRAIRCSRATGTPLHIEYRLQTRDGTMLWFRDEGKAVRDESGRLLFFQGILLDVTRSKHTEHALRQSEEQLRSLAAHLESIKEEERKRIARELHDELGGLLTAINAHVSVCLRRSSAGGSPPDDLLVEARDLAKRALQAVRRVITDLRPSVLDQLGIWAALEWYTEQVERCSGLDGECVIEPQAMALELDPERSTMLFRIVQETLTNVVRHAGATRVVVHVRYEEAQLIVEIADDGNGKVSAETSSYEKSWGIIGMHERSRHFGGELKITGTPGAGTVVVLKLPVEKS